MSEYVDTSRSAIRLEEYVDETIETDRLDKGDLQPILFGLFGEVGGIMAAIKKHKRERSAFVGYRHAVVEEFGDALWYFTALSRRVGVRIDAVFAAATQNGRYTKTITANDLLAGAVAEVSSVTLLPALDQTLKNLGIATAALFSNETSAPPRELFVNFADAYLQALGAANVSFAEVVRGNLLKVRGRFLNPDLERLPTFDDAFPVDERLPDTFEITIRERRSGQSCLQWNGVYIGDPLTDNIRDPDGYRFHDVFHFANAAILHWSPTFRALIKHKRKSNPRVDEEQDSGRAIVIEEGISAWIFSRAKLLSLFEGQTDVSFDMLKTVSQFVSGYEVDVIPLKLWEDAILQGYAAFRQVRSNNGGVLVGNRGTRTLTYKPL
jgi:NTP pyrophosphatase (non-canonical NTP hydrolase)